MREKVVRKTFPVPVCWKDRKRNSDFSDLTGRRVEEMEKVQFTPVESRDASLKTSGITHNIDYMM